MPWANPVKPGLTLSAIAGSTGSALRAVRPPNLHITPNVQRDLVHAASATGSLCRSPLAIMAQAILGVSGIILLSLDVRLREILLCLPSN
jgi:hypothetical protein